MNNLINFLKRWNGFSVLLIVACIQCGDVFAQTEGELVLRRTIDGKFIPIHLKGYSGEVEQALRFDLEIQGFRVVEEERAQFVLAGKNDAQVEGRLQDRLKDAALFAKRYSGTSLRAQAHALSDEVVQSITGNKGIASTKVVFRIRSGTGSEVYVSDYDGFNARQMTRDATIVRAPTWSSGGSALYYTSYMNGNPDIYMHEVATGKRLSVVRFLGTNSGANVSPDGAKLAFTSGRAGRGPDLYVSEISGQSLVRLTRTVEAESSPTWSPDGKTICFVSQVGSRPKLFIVPASGGEMKRLATSGALNATEPDWSPDGKTIAFTLQSGGGFELCLVPAGGGEVDFLGVQGEDPSWSPNSRTLIFTRRSASGSKTLSLLDVETKQVKDVRRSVNGEYSEAAWAR